MRSWIICLAVLSALTTQARAQVKGPEMVRIPGGTFTMGTSYAEDEREGVPQQDRERSKPQHNVTVQPFLLAKTTVTRGEFAAFVRAMGERPGNGGWLSSGGCHGAKIEEKDGNRKVIWEKDSTWDWRHPGFDQTDNDPVVCVSHDDAVAYIGWLNTQVTGKPYRLPSEAEWEYAARGKANQKAAHFLGDDRASACTYANVASRELAAAWRFSPDNEGFFPCADGFARTAPVGSFKPNDYGLYDMLGNVLQWTADCWNENYDNAPNNGTIVTSGSCGLRAVRGGSWGNAPWSVRAGYRIWDVTGSRGTVSGFRLARAL